MLQRDVQAVSCRRPGQPGGAGVRAGRGWRAGAALPALHPELWQTELWAPLAEQEPGHPFTRAQPPTFCLESRGGGQRSVCDSSLQHITSSEQTSSSGQLWGQGLRTGSRTRSSHKKIRTQERAVGPAGADSDTLESLPRARFVWSVGAEAAAKKQETSVTSPVAAV